MSALRNPSGVEVTLQMDYHEAQIGDVPKRLTVKPRIRLTKRQADFITAVSNVIFAVALLPTVLAGTALPIASSAATLVALLLLGVVLANFRLWWGLFWNIMCAGMWAILLVMAL